MDKEAQEKIAETLKVCGANPITANALAWDLIGELEKLGYYKLPKDKPPLLSEVIRRERAKNIVGASYSTVLENVNWLAQAQREADIALWGVNNG